MLRLPQVVFAKRATPTALAAALVAGVSLASLGATPDLQRGLPAQQDHVRRLPLEGARNLRDIGGYATTDGKHVKWGQVYRSGQLAQLTDKDYEYLAGLGISSVCDFRRDDERRAAPTNWRGPNPPEILSLPAAPGVPSGISGPSARQLVASGASAAEVAGSMRASYEQYIV